MWLGETAKVYISIIGDEQRKSDTLKGLEIAASAACQLAKTDLENPRA